MKTPFRVLISKFYLLILGDKIIKYSIQHLFGSYPRPGTRYNVNCGSKKLGSTPNLEWFFTKNSVVDWTNIQKKTTKGAYNNENSKFVVFNNWSSWRSSQNSDHSFPKLIFTPQSMRLKNIGVKCCFAHPILFLWKTQVLENTDFLWLIETDF